MVSKRFLTGHVENTKTYTVLSQRLSVLKLPERLRSIAGFIPAGSTVVDIGTDHALLPIYLVKYGIAPKVIAGDLNAGPLEAAQKNVTEAGFADKINLRQGDGFDIIRPGEAELAVIAGMGGSTIRQIVQNAGEKAGQIKQLVLQPMADSGHLREWLVDNGWRIADEDLVNEDGRLYEVISAVPGTEETTDRTLISIGPRLFDKKHPLLYELLTGEIDKNRKIISEMERSSSVDTMTKRQNLLDRTERLEWVLKCLSNVRR